MNLHIAVLNSYIYVYKQLKSESSNALWFSRMKNHALRGREHFWIEDQGKFYLFCVLGNM